MEETRKILYIAATMIATVIGAGFATGQEIYTFFVRYGNWSFSGILFVLFLFWFLFYYVLKICYVQRIDDVAQLLELLPGRIRGFGTVCIALFSFCGFCAMASATGELAKQSIGCSEYFGVFGMLLLCALILVSGITAIAKVNLVLAPLICIGLAVVSLQGICNRSVETFAGLHYYMDIAAVLVSAIVYASYNLLSALSVLASMRRYCQSLKTAKYASFLAAAVLTFVAGLIWLVLKIYSGKIVLGSLPMLRVASRRGEVYEHIYIVLLLASILTTAMGCGHACLIFLHAKFGLKIGFATLLLVISAAPVALLGFSQIVRVFYTFFGYLGIPLIILLLFEYTKNTRKCKNKSKKVENEVKRILQ